MLVGGKPHGGVEDIRRLLPLLGAALLGEHTARTAEVHAAVAQRAAERATELARALDAARRELRSALAEAEVAGRAKDQFMAVLSHELRTPVEPRAGQRHGIARRRYDPRLLRPTLETIRRNVSWRRRLIDDLLDVTRIRHGKLRLSREPVDAHAVVRQAWRSAGARAPPAGFLMEVELTAARHYVEADAARLQQIAWNVLKNAIKFSPAGGKIVVRTRNEVGPPTPRGSSSRSATRASASPPRPCPRSSTRSNREERRSPASSAAWVWASRFPGAGRSSRRDPGRRERRAESRGDLHPRTADDPIAIAAVDRRPKPEQHPAQPRPEFAHPTRGRSLRYARDHGARTP